MTADPERQSAKSSLYLSLRRWFDAEVAAADIAADDSKRVDWVRILPLIFLHVACIGVIWTGWSWTAVLTAIGLYVIRMFAITGFYHRYFSLKSEASDA